MEQTTLFDPADVIAAVTTATNDTMQMILGLLPIALTVFAAIWGTKVAIRFFRGMAKG